MRANSAIATLASETNFSGRQKAAILCMALGAEGAAKITQKLSPEEAEAISFEIARKFVTFVMKLYTVRKEKPKKTDDLIADLAGVFADGAKPQHRMLRHLHGHDGGQRPRGQDRPFHRRHAGVHRPGCHDRSGAVRAHSNSDHELFGGLRADRAADGAPGLFLVRHAGGRARQGSP